MVCAGELPLELIIRMKRAACLTAGGEGVTTFTFGQWSSQQAVKSTLVIAEPFTAFARDSALVQNEVAGKIVLIERATVPSGEQRGKNGFGIKALAAQNAGAAAVIFMNNDEAHPDDVIGMGSTNTVNIPVLMISHNEGVRIKGLGSDVPVIFDPGCEVKLSDNKGFTLPSNIGELGDDITELDLSGCSLQGASFVLLC